MKFEERDIDWAVIEKSFRLEKDGGYEYYAIQFSRDQHEVYLYWSNPKKFKDFVFWRITDSKIKCYILSDIKLHLLLPAFKEGLKTLKTAKNIFEKFKGDKIK
jgi:hypothetical protein